MSSERELPSGSVTFVFTDVEGSTRLVERDQAAAGRALARHHDLLHAATLAHDGAVFETVGDAVYAAFSEPASGVAAAVAMQRSMTVADWRETGRLRIRAAVHTGPVERRGSHYFGAPLFVCARLQALAHGGQTVVSGHTAALVTEQTGRVDGGWSLQPLGRHRLKDLAEPIAVWQASAAGLDESFPPLRSPVAAPNNLPSPATSFVGREAELREVGERLAQARIVTLLGPGGTGKTRLAIEAAREWLTNHPDGAFIVDLAALREASLIPGAIAAAIGLRPTGDESIEAALQTHLQDLETLLVVDNWEHLVDGAGIAAALVERAPHLRILATSRVPLGIAGEHRIRLSPLPVPAQPEPGSVPATSDALRLFADRARTVDPDFVIDGANAADVAAICRHVDGLPLGIELAASRIDVLPPTALRAALEGAGDSLLFGGVDRPDRHRSLAATVAWSVDLLEPGDRTLFTRLGVFGSSFEVDTVRRVVEGPGLAPLDTDPLASIGRLADASLIVRRDDPVGGVRYGMLDTLRSVAAARLAQSDEVEAVRARHGDWAADFAEAGLAGLLGADAVRWLARIRIDESEIRSALHWAVSVGSGEVAARIAGAMWRHWADSLAYDEAIAESGATLELDLPPRWRAKVLNTLGLARTWKQDHAEAESALLAAQSIYRETGPLGELAETTNNLALVAAFSGDTDGAMRLLEECSRIWKEAGDPRGESLAAGNLSELYLWRGDTDTALDLARHSMARAEASGSTRSIAEANLSQALILVGMGRGAEVGGALTKALRVLRDLDDRRLLVTALLCRSVEVLCVDPPDAVRAARLVGAARGVDLNARAHVALDPGDMAAEELALRGTLDRLGPDGLERAIAEGQALDVDAAVRYALGEADPFALNPPTPDPPGG